MSIKTEVPPPIIENPGVPKRKVIGTMFIDIYSDGGVEVRGLPPQMETALQVLATGMIRTAQHFRTLAVNDQRIVKPNFNVVNKVNQSKRN